MFDKTEIIIIWTAGMFGAMVILCHVLYSAINSRIIEEKEALWGDLMHSMDAHQKWLFHQLYSMAPGKVLKPDETEPKSEGEPAKVYSPTEDPMSEFSGNRDDWRS